MEVGARVVRPRPTGLAWRDVEDGLVLLDLGRSIYLKLNPSAALLWHRLLGGATEDELATALQDEFGIGPEQAATDVRLLADQLRGRGLLAE